MSIVSESDAHIGHVDVTDPWACHLCGRKDWRVADSRFDGVQRKRQRVCVHCNTALPTVELPQPAGFIVIAVRNVKTDEVD